MPEKAPIIQADGLSKYYGDRIALKNASFTITQGECIGFLGRNGAGKSTLLKILATALLPSAGTVRIGPHDAVNDPDGARRLLGFLPEDPPLYPEMTVRAYLTFLAKLRGVSADKVEARVADVVAKTSLKDVIDDAIGTLSLGFRKRVGIAQAIVHDPAVVIVDEPISGLDPVQIVEIRNLIRALRGIHTVLVSSHILSELSETCDRFLLVDRGAIVAQGTEAELTRGHTKLSYEIEVRGTAATLESALGQVAEVTKKTVRSEGDTAFARVDLSVDVPEKLAGKIIAAGLGLRKLAPVPTDLESVFLEITGNTIKAESLGERRMKEAWLIASRELAAYLKSPLGYIVAASALFIDGILFNGWALSADNALSAEVLRAFFYFSGGLTMIASVLLSMRSFAEERQSGTLVLLFTAPVREWQIVLGKFLAAFLMLAILVLLSIYLPMLIFVNGRVSMGQVFAGYVGLLALGACTTAMGVFASALTRSQLIAAVVAGLIIGTFLATWKLADITSPPISDALGYLALFDKHFYPTFTKGLVSVKDLFFFAALSFIFLMGTSKVLAARRWVG